MVSPGLNGSTGGSHQILTQICVKGTEETQGRNQGVLAIENRRLLAGVFGAASLKIGGRPYPPMKSSPAFSDILACDTLGPWDTSPDLPIGFRETSLACSVPNLVEIPGCLGYRKLQHWPAFSWVHLESRVFPGSTDIRA